MFFDICNTNKINVLGKTNPVGSSDIQRSRSVRAGKGTKSDCGEQACSHKDR